MKFWINKKLYELQKGKTLEEAVNAMTQPQFLKVEIKQNGKWAEWKDDTSNIRISE